MTLSVHVFRLDDDGEMTLLDPPSPGSELAGFESFRTGVWGSEVVRELGARFLPALADGELVVAPGDVMEFLEECALLRANLDTVARATAPGYPHARHVEVVSTRVANLEAAARRALAVSGGVVIW
jgi:hypothetical protein